MFAAPKTFAIFAECLTSGAQTTVSSASVLPELFTQLGGGGGGIQTWSKGIQKWFCPQATGNTGMKPQHRRGTRSRQPLKEAGRPLKADTCLLHDVHDVGLSWG